MLHCEMQMCNCHDESFVGAFVPNFDYLPNVIGHQPALKVGYHNVTHVGS